MSPNLTPRRDFLRSSATLAALIAFGNKAPWLFADDANPYATDQPSAKLPTADQWIPGKHPQLIVHSIKTGEIETPLSLLREHKITPKSILFVRNNQLLENSLSLEPAPNAKEWSIELAGLISKSQSIDVATLSKLPQHEVEMVLQCSGNSRSRFAKTVKADGIQWTNGAVANVVFKGVKLSDVVKHLQLDLAPEVQFLSFEGKEGPVAEGKPDFEHSIPISVALDRTLIALELNGEAIPIAHGGPARLVTPGYYATNHIKWLSKLRFEATESDNYHHIGRYRTPYKPIKPGTPFESTLENSEPNWDMKIKSLIFSPLEGEKLKLGQLKISGVVWNDGQSKIAAVEVSIDGGKSWHASNIQPAASRYAWSLWSIDLNLTRGKHAILSRAVDELGNSQPLDGSIAWNPAGYVWNGVDEVVVEVE